VSVSETDLRTQGSIAFDRLGTLSVLRADQWLPADRQAIWRFVTDCRHMNEVLPDFIRFKVLDVRAGHHPPRLAEGVTYRYRLYLHGVGVTWKTWVTVVDPPQRFIDIQARGPYASFEHEHRFVEEAGGTRLLDVIRYRAPGGPLAGLVDRLYVRRSLRKLFENRHRRLEKLFTPGADPGAAFYGEDSAAELRSADTMNPTVPASLGPAA
jgi:ligand-binding SRPBCC domain-containing protein